MLATARQTPASKNGGGAGAASVLAAKARGEERAGSPAPCPSVRAAASLPGLLGSGVNISISTGGFPRQRRGHGMLWELGAPAPSKVFLWWPEPAESSDAVPLLLAGSWEG